MHLPTWRQRTLPSFIFGLLAGCSISYIAYWSMADDAHERYLMFLNKQYRQQLSQLGPHRIGNESEIDWPFGNFNMSGKSFHDHTHDSTDDLSQKVRVLCWVMTNPANHKSKALHVKTTWGKRCNIILFMSTKKDNELPTVALPMKHEDRDHLWEKTKLSFQYVYEFYRDKADWFLKADDDSYFVIENLRYFLRPFNRSQPIFFGHKFKMFVKQGYMSGGAGYVLSAEALRRFATDGVQKCRKDGGGAEDVEMGKCMDLLGVESGNSRDEEGGERFLPMTPYIHLIEGSIPKSHWFWSYTFYPQGKGEKSVSHSFISFHYVDPVMMHVLDFMLYHARPYGVKAWFEGGDESHVNTSVHST